MLAKLVVQLIGCLFAWRVLLMFGRAVVGRAAFENSQEWLEQPVHKDIGEAVADLYTRSREEGGGWGGGGAGVGPGWMDLRMLMGQFVRIETVQSRIRSVGLLHAACHQLLDAIGRG